MFINHVSNVDNTIGNCCVVNRKQTCELSIDIGTREFK